METDKPPDCLVLAFDLDAMGIPRDDDPALLEAAAAALRKAALSAVPCPPPALQYLCALRRRDGRDMLVIIVPGGQFADGSSALDGGDFVYIGDAVQQYLLDHGLLPDPIADDAQAFLNGHPGDWPTDDLGPIDIDWIVPPQGDDDDDPAEWWKHQGDDHAHTE